MAILFVLACLTGSPSAFPEPQQDGRIVDAKTGRAIAGADVTVAGARASRTDQDGRFRWPDVPTGAIVVVVILPDGRAGRPVTVAPGERLQDLVLKIEVGYGESVTVPGVAPGIDVSAGASSTALLEADLSLRRPATLAQSLENVPGIAAISEGQGATPAIRGLARGRTLILVDGARVSSERGAGPNASFLDPGTLGRIDVVRGPGSVAYGTEAFGGVIAARSRWPLPSAGFGARFTGTTGAGLPEHRGDLELSFGYGGGAVLVGARAREFEDYAPPEGEVPFSGWRDNGGRVLWKQTVGGNQIAAGLQIDEATDIGRPRNDSNTIVATSPFERSRRFTLSLDRAALGPWRDLRVTSFVGSSEQRTEQDRLPAPGRPRRIDRADGSARDLQVRATGRRPLGPVSFHGGVDLQRRFGVTAGDTAFIFGAAGALTSTTATATIESANRTALGTFAEGDVQFRPWLRANAGVRADGIRGDNKGGFFGNRTTRRTAFSGMAAVTVAPTPTLSVTAQIARGFREPTLTDRFSRGPVGRGFLEGNPDLEPETSRQYDLTARYAAGRLQMTGAAYRYDISQLIERYTAGLDLFRIRNRGRARLTGAEAEARVAVGAGLTVDVIAQVSRGRDAVDDVPLDDVAPRSIGFIARHVWRDRVSSYLRLSAIAAHEDAGPSEVPTPGYTLLDAAAGWQVGSALELRATFRNLLDASFYSSSGPRWVWAPGRQAAVTIVVRLGRWSI
jgi:outer membrane receptor protein involved in Fe transport